MTLPPLQALRNNLCIWWRRQRRPRQWKKVGEKGWSPWCGWEDQAKGWEIQEKCTTFPVQPSQVSLVPGLICGCWMSKPGSWLPCLWPASPPITKLLLPFQALCLLHPVLSSSSSSSLTDACMKDNTVPCCRMIHIMPLKEKILLTARTTYPSSAYHLPGLIFLLTISCTITLWKALVLNPFSVPSVFCLWGAIALWNISFSLSSFVLLFFPLHTVHFL